MASAATRSGPETALETVHTTSSPTAGRIRLTRELQAIGFTLDDALDTLAAHDAGGAACESERWRLQAVLDRVDAKLAELTALRGRIVDAQEACENGRCLLVRQ